MPAESDAIRLHSISESEAPQPRLMTSGSPAIIDFAEVVKRRGVDLRQSRLFRHNEEGARQWHRGRDCFGHFASYQGGTPYNSCRYAFQCIPERPLDDGDQAALFVGAMCVGHKWRHNRRRKARMSTPDAIRNSNYRPELGLNAYDLTWMPAFDDLAGRLVIRWGPVAATRAWSQWAHKNRKDVIELRRHAAEPRFPGFAEFATEFDEIRFLWRSWHDHLAAVKGVYLLVHPDGDQYVGSCGPSARGGEGRAGSNPCAGAPKVNLGDPGDAVRRVRWIAALAASGHGQDHLSRPGRRYERMIRTVMAGNIGKRRLVMSLTNVNSNV